MEKIELRKAGKDCLISYNGSKYYVTSKYALKEVVVRKLGNTVVYVTKISLSLNTKYLTLKTAIMSILPITKT